MRFSSQRHAAILLAGLTLATVVRASLPEALSPAPSTVPPLPMPAEPAVTAKGEAAHPLAALSIVHLPPAMLTPAAPAISQTSDKGQYAMGMFYKRGLGLPRPKGK